MAVGGLPLVESLLLELGTICDCDYDERLSIQVEGRQGKVGGWRHVGYEVVEYSPVGEGQGRELVCR